MNVTCLMEHQALRSNAACVKWIKGRTTMKRKLFNIQIESVYCKLSAYKFIFFY